MNIEGQNERKTQPFGEVDMLQSVRALLEMRVRATDGKVGKAQDFYFDDGTWAIRSVVVNTGGWLRHGVLVPPGRFAPPEAAGQVLSVSLTKQQVRESAGSETEETLAQHQEDIIHEQYGASAYQAGGGPVGALHGNVSESALAMAEAQANEAGGQRKEPRRYLRSTREIIGYQVEARDGAAGLVDDFIIGDDDWLIHYLVIDTRNKRLPNPKVLVPAVWVEFMSWADSRVYLQVQRDRVQGSQKYDPASHGHLEKPSGALKR